MKITKGKVTFISRFNCQNCEDIRWVCENHDNKPWGEATDSPNSCDCGAGSPCKICNNGEYIEDIPGCTAICEVE